MNWRDIVLIILAVCYTLQAFFACDTQKQLNEIKQNLRRYFEQIDYKNLDLLMKSRKDNTDTPPNDGE